MTDSLLMIDQLLMIQYVNDSLNVDLFCCSEEMVGGAEVPIISPAKKLEDLIRLAELCVDLLRQNEEFYAEVMFFSRFYSAFCFICHFIYY